MATSIYVGNLPFAASEDDVRELFRTYGDVHRLTLPVDRDTGRPRGFGFVEMDDGPARLAIRALDGVDFRGRTIKVNEARPRSSG